MTTSTTLFAIFGLVLRQRAHPQISNAFAEQSYTEHADKNAQNGAGAVDIDVKPVTGLTAVECKQRCTNDAKCECVTFHDASTTSCMKRKQCDPSKFAVARKENGGAFFVYMKIATTTKPATTTQPVTTTAQPVRTTAQPVRTTKKPVTTTKQTVTTKRGATTKRGVYILEDFVRLHPHSDYCFPRL